MIAQTPVPRRLGMRVKEGMSEKKVVTIDPIDIQKREAVRPTRRAMPVRLRRILRSQAARLLVILREIKETEE